MTQRPLLGALAVLTRGDEVLMVKRGKSPNRGLWGFPGGHVEWGETVEEAATRELAEETGLQARADGTLGNLDLIIRAEDGTVERHYLLVAIACTGGSGTPVAADDAEDAAWLRRADLGQYPCSANVEKVLGWLDARS